MSFHLKETTDPNELDILKKRSATYKEFEFTFSDEYISKLKLSLNEPHALQLIATEDGTNKFAGYIAASEKLFPKYLYIQELFIEPEFQQKGVATELINTIIQHAKNRNLKGVYVQSEYVNIPAQHIYAKLGFKKTENKTWVEGLTYKLDFSPEN